MNWPHAPAILYLPFYRRLLLRTTAVWAALRLVLAYFHAQWLAETGERTLQGTGLHPAAALGLIGFVLAIDMIHARAMRESVFRANAGISNCSVLLPVAVLLVSLELALRAAL